MVSRILLVDGNHLARRAYFTVGKTLKTVDGQLSGVIFAAMRSLRKIAIENATAKMILFFDGGHTKASKLYDEYKKNKGRDRSEDFYKQCGVFEDLAEACGIKTVCVRGVEADTLIGAATGHFVDKGFDVSIVSSDHDFYQLVRKGVDVYDDLRGERIDRAELRRRWPHLQPRDFIAVKCYAGDRSDNISGLPGLGERAALALAEKLPFAELCIFAKSRDAAAPDPEEFDKRLKWRIAKAFEDVRAAKALLRRNIALVRLPRKAKELDEPVRVQFTRQLDRVVNLNSAAAKGIMREYQLTSILSQFDTWVQPLVRAGLGV